MAGVVLKAVSKRFGHVRALHEVDIHCGAGVLTVLLGHSGAGKTTTLRLIAGLETPDSGQIRIGDVVVNDLPSRRRGVSIAFESYALYPQKTAFENVAFSFHVAARGGTTTEQVRRRVSEIAEILQIEHLLGRLPRQLSGGQRQRVALGRALARDASVHLLDEPIAHLDAKLRHRLRSELKHLQKERGRTTIWCTPDQLEAMSIADWLAVIREGTKVQEGRPSDLYERPRNRFVAQSLGEPAMNFFEAEAEQRSGVWHLTTAEWSLSVAGRDAAPLTRLNGKRRVTLGVRPSDIGIATEHPEAPAFEGDVVTFEPLGSHSVVTAKTDAQTFKVKTGGDVELDPGDRVWFTPNPSKYHFFDPDSGEAV